MNDPLSKTLEGIREVAKNSGLQLFCGWLSENNNIPEVHWDKDNGGDWKNFLGCARAMNANVLYLTSAPFERSQIDEAIANLESELSEHEGKKNDTSETKELLSQVRAFEPKVGLTCTIELAFVANGVIHIYQEAPDWFDEFEGLLTEEDDREPEERKPADKATVNKWAMVLAGDQKYITSKDREYLLEKLAGDEFLVLPVFEILRRAETIFQADFRQVAEERLAEEIRQLREQGLNMSAIAAKVGIPRDRVSGLMSAMRNRR
ncbi:MAG: hypothetical protein ACYDCD_13865 [Candidatus Acidiferrales bacterium]